MSHHAKAFMQEFRQAEEGRELADRVLLSLRLGRLVYKMRTSSGLSQEALAERIGSTQSAISRLESGNGGHVPGNELLECIARSCGFRMAIRAEPLGEVGLESEDLATSVSIALNHDKGMEQI